MSDSLLAIYNKQPITFTKGDGVWLYDKEGNQYLDALSGIGVCALGHNHPAITKAIQTQAEQLLHVANNYFTEAQSKLAEKLCQMTQLDATYFSNSGTEANEAAIKMALKFGIDNGIANPKIVTIKGCFHGRSLGAWSASCPQQNSQFGPLLPDFLQVSFNNIDEINALRSRKDIVAVMLEPVLGKGGLRPVSSSYLQQLRQLCDEENWLLILDEVQSGMGRTGKLFAYQHADITPDIVTTAKALGNGIPIGAYITSKKASGIFKPGDHGSTQGGNVFACQVALTVLNTLEQEQLMANAALIGAYLREQLAIALKPFPILKAIQGKGLMIGICLHEPVKNSIKIGLEHGIVFNNAGADVIRLLPPYIYTQADADLLIERLVKCFEVFD